MSCRQSVILLIQSAAFFCTQWLLPGSVNAEEPQPSGRWRFTAADVRGDRVRPLAGSLAGTLTGPARFGGQPQCLLLDGKTNQVNLTDDLAQADLPKQALTAEAWVWLEAAPDWGGIVGAIQDNGNFEKGWLLGTQKEQFTFALSTRGADDGDGKLTYLTANARFETGQWYHVVGTYDGQTQKIYVDGQLKNQSAVQAGAINYPAQAAYCIGAYRDDDEHYLWPGRLAEVNVYDQALSADAIAARFAASVREFPNIEPAPSVVTGWPTYLRDDARTGMTPEEVALPLSLRWTYRAQQPPNPAWPPPAKQDFWNGHSNLQPRVIYDRANHVVSVDGRVFFGSSADDQVRCLDVRTGKTLWTFFTESPVRLAPHIADGRVYFGSDDGYVYCLDASDGMLRWKFQAAPSDRRIPGNGRLISAWPVRSGVLVHEGVAHFSAGLFPLQGTYRFALDADTGERISQETIEISSQGYLERRGSQLLASVGRAPKTFFSQLRQQRKGTGAYLWQMNKDYPYAIIGAGDVRFVGGAGKVAALAAEDGKLLWNAEVEGDAYSLAVAAGCLLVSTSQGNVYCFAPAAEQGAGPGESLGPSAQPFAYPSEQVRLDYEAAARQIVAATGVTKGYCLIVDSEQGYLAQALAQQTELQVIGLEDDPDKVAASRAALDRAGLYGRAAILQGWLDQLPVGDSLMNLVVSDGLLNSGRLPGLVSEVQRVLRPDGGVAYLGQAKTDTPESESDSRLDEASLAGWLGAAAGDWEILRERGLWAKYARGPLRGAGEWTHLYANPANTACSEDARVEGPVAIQWFGRPGPRLMVDRHHRTAAPLYKNGRLFIPGDNHVFAVDAYNGTPLWHHEVPHSRRIGVARDHGYLAAGDDALLVVAEDRCHRFDAATGAEAIPWQVPSAADGQSRHWGYVAHLGDRVLGSATKPGASRDGHSKAAIEEGTYFDFREIITSDFVFCFDSPSGNLRWKYDENAGAILNPTLTVDESRMVFIESANAATRAKANGRSTLSALVGAGANLVALDLATGQVLWKSAVDLRAIEHHLYLASAKGVLVAVGSRNVDTGHKDDKGRKIEHVWYDTRAFDAKTGKLLWSRSQDNHDRSGGDHGEQDHHPVIVGDTVYVEPLAYSLFTGEPRADWKLSRGGHGCGTISASSSTLFFRAGNPTMCSLATGENAKVNLVSRPGCWINTIPAGGLLLIPEASSGCSCNFPLQTSMAFIPQSVLRPAPHLVKRELPPTVRADDAAATDSAQGAR